MPRTPEEVGVRKASYTPEGGGVYGGRIHTQREVGETSYTPTRGDLWEASYTPERKGGGSVSYTGRLNVSRWPNSMQIVLAACVLILGA